MNKWNCGLSMRERGKIGRISELKKTERGRKIGTVERGIVTPKKKTAMIIAIRDDRHMRSLTGLSVRQFEILLSAFVYVYEEMREQAYEAAVAAGERKRGLGGGQKGRLRTIADKLLFVLYYFKVYPTFDVLGTQFGLDRSKAHENLYKLVPVLYQTLVELEMMPAREFASVEEMKAALQGIDSVIIDVTERVMRRSTDAETQKEYYSGKKKRHTIKNTVMTTLTKFILFVGRTFTGRNHDYTMLKTEFPPDEDWFAQLRVLVDAAYQGIRTDYVGDDISHPHKKPRKSKSNPDPALSDEQKSFNHALSKLRIFVENAIGGAKRYNILVHRFRNHRDRFDDDVIGISAALWNFSQSY